MKKFALNLILFICFLVSPIFTNEPILFCAIEKSGSCYVATKLRKGLEKPLVVISNSDFPAWHIQPQKFARFIQMNALAREHLIPSLENLALIKSSGIKMIFHIRDLRQIVVSFAFYHQERIKEDPTVVQSYRNEGYYGVDSWSLNDLIEHFITRVPEIVDRIQGWLKASQEGSIPILITTFEELVDNEQLFFERILDFYNIPKETFVPSYVPKDKFVKFRKGSKNEWRYVLSLEQQQRINNMIPDEFFTFFKWER